MQLDITRHLENVEKIIASHQIAAGQYSRWLWQDKTGSRKLGINEYGCADAANILYMIGRFPSQAEERGKWISALQSLQNPETGLFVEATHHPIHTTAHCIAALELFEQKARYPLKDLKPYLEKEKLYQLLDGLDWSGNPWLPIRERVSLRRWFCKRTRTVFGGIGILNGSGMSRTLKPVFGGRTV